MNAGGKNKISMREPQAAFEEQEFSSIATYINSGNVVFDSDLHETAVWKCCEELIESSFGLKITVCIISADELLETLKSARTDGAPM